MYQLHLGHPSTSSEDRPPRSWDVESQDRGGYGQPTPSARLSQAEIPDR